MDTTETPSLLTHVLCCDGVPCTIPIAFLPLFKTVQAAVDECAMEGAGCSSDNPIPLPLVTSANLEIMLRVCAAIGADANKRASELSSTQQPAADNVSNHETINRKPKTEDDCNYEAASSVYAALPVSELTHAVNAANSIGLELLVRTSTRYIANLIKYKTPQQIRTLFDIVNDLTEEDIREMQLSDKWKPLYDMENQSLMHNMLK